MSRALLFVLCLFLSGACAAQELGRLFFTPDQRAALDARRKARVPDRPAAATNVSPTMRVDGYVKRSGGRSTVFVNGEPADDGRAPAAGESTVSVGVGEAGARVRMRPGETLDRGNGELRDVIGEGEIRIRRGGAAK